MAVEVDGWAWHVDPELSQSPDTATLSYESPEQVGPCLTTAIQNDRRKQNALVGEKWDLLRFTWHDLVERPEVVVAEIRAALGIA